MTSSKLTAHFLAATVAQGLYPLMHNSSILFQTSGWNAARFFAPFYGPEGAFPLLFIQRPGDGAFALPADALQRAAEIAALRAWQEPAVFEAQHRAYAQARDTIVQGYTELTSDAFAALPAATARARVKEALETAWVANAAAFFSTHFDRAFVGWLSERVPGLPSAARVDALWEQLTAPSTPSFDARHARYISERLRDASVQAVAEGCQHFFTNYAFVPSIAQTMERLATEIPDAGPALLARLDAEQHERAERHQAFLATLAPEERRLAEYAQQVIALRDERKDVILQAVVVVFRFAAHLARMQGIPPEHMYASTFAELIGENPIQEAVLAARATDAVVLVSTEGVLEMETGTATDAMRALDAAFLAPEKLQEKELRGQTGSPGRIVGRVRVVRVLARDGAAFQDGEVLVTGMTRPEYVPLMRRAGAVITDEGGVTCHAAIVSRELGLPCIIGTKFATRVLNDGDEVEVDASAGVIRILTRS